MFSSIITGLTLASVAVAAPTAAKRGGVSITPHDKFSSSIGVLGCHIDTNRVAYFPSFPSCDSVCIKVSTDKAELYLLQIDQSGGAHDISYDAWNMLNTGESATSNPTTGGGIPATVEPADMDKCSDLIKTPDGKLPLMAANSIGFYIGCGADSWVGKNSALYNIQNSACTMGHDEVCELDLNVSNQPSCPHTLGSQDKLPKDLQVMDIAYGSGDKTPAL